MLKKVLLHILILLIILSTTVTQVNAQATNIKVLLNESQLGFDVEPVLVDGNVLVPARKIFESLGMKVSYDSTTKTVFAYGNTAIVLKIGEKVATVVDKKIEMPIASKIENGRVLVPLRFIAESTGANVKWDGEGRTVHISTQISKEGNAVDKVDVSGIQYK